MSNRILRGILFSFFFLLLFIFEINYVQNSNAQNQEEIAREFKAIGIKSYNEQNYKKAIEALQRARFIKKEDFEIYFFLGLSYYQTRKYQDAIAALKFARFYNPQFAEAYYYLGLAYFDIKMLDEALNQFKEALKYKSNYLEAAYRLGLIYKEKKRDNAAIKYFKEVTRVNPNFIEAYDELWKIYQNNKEFDKMITFLDSVISKVKNANSFYFLGLAYYHKSSKYPQAMSERLDIKNLQRATGIDPFHKDAYLLLGEIYLNSRSYIEAIEVYERILMIDSENAIALSNIRVAREKQVQMKINKLFYQGSSLFNNEKWKESIALFDQVLSINPNYLPAFEKKEIAKTKLIYQEFFNKGFKAKQEGEIENAMRNFQLALKFAMTDNETEKILGLQSELSNDLEELERNQKADQFLNEGLADYQKHNLDEALDKFKIAYTFSPSRTDIKKKIKETYYEMTQEAKKNKEWKLANQFAQKMFEFDPDVLEVKKINEEIQEIKNELRKKNLISSFFARMPIILSVLSVLGVFIIGYIGFKGFKKISEGFRKSQEIREILSEARFNPYVSGQPVYEENLFIHMKPTINSISRGIHRNSYLIMGERRIGKTSFLQLMTKKIKELNEIEDEYIFIPFFLDLQKATEKTVFHIFARELLKDVKKYFVAPLDLNFSESKQDYSSQDLTFDLQDIIRHLSENKTRQIRLIFIVDELDKMNDYPDHIKSSFRSLFTDENSENLKVIASATHIKELTSEGSPWCNFFIEEQMRPFTEKEAQRLIEEPVQGIFTYTKEAIVKIISRTEKKPNLIQDFCRKLVDRAWEKGRDVITLEDVEAIYQKIS